MASSLQKGINAAKSGHMHDALEFLKDAIIEEPQNAEVWVWIAAIIDDMDKQEIFLEKALDLDPNNIPAQRGLAYLHNRKQEQSSVQQDHLSDHTQPISPFPSPQKRQEVKKDGEWAKISEEELEQVAQSSESKAQEVKKKEISTPKLSLFEMTLLGVIVVVFCFIGLLAASSIFKFELPLDFLRGNKPTLAAEPPYQGVFLYENGIFFDIQQFQGLPQTDIGMPTSYNEQPVIVFWKINIEPEYLQMVYQNGAIISFKTSPQLQKGILLQPERKIQNGLYCLHAPGDTEKEAIYWCFKIAEPPIIE